jgi:hypothetical protein
VGVLARGDPHRRDLRPDDGVREDVVGARGLLDPVGVELGQPGDPGGCLVDVPPLVRVDSDPDPGPDRLTGDGQAAQVVVDGGADLELDQLEPVVVYAG